MISYFRSLSSLFSSYPWYSVQVHEEETPRQLKFEFWICAKVTSQQRPSESVFTWNLKLNLPGNEILFCHVKNSVYIRFNCGWNEMNLFSVFIFWSTTFVFMKYSHVQMFPSESFHFRTVFTWYLPVVKMTAMKWQP